MKNLIFTFTVLVLLCTQFTMGQQVGLYGSIFQAQGEFNDNLNKNPMGLSANIVFPVGENKRLNVGAELGVAMYSNLMYDTVDKNGNDISVDEEDCFWNVFFLAQFHVYDTPNMKVYAEGRLGMSTFFSSKTYYNGTSYEDDFKFHGTSFNSGIGGGVKLNIIGILSANPDRYKWLWLDLAATMNSGSKSHYRNAEETSISLEDADYESLTNNINYRIGVSFNFSRN